MTVSTEVDHNDYTGNGVTTVFPYHFRIFKQSDLTVVTIDLDDNQSELILGTDYSVTGAGTYQGGTVVLLSPLASGWKISVARVLPVTQETDLRNQGKFFAEVHENAFDKLTMLIQQCFGWLRLALCKPSFIANYFDALNNFIRNLRDPVRPQDAATKNYVDSLADTNLSKTIRVPEPINELPTAEMRANKIPAFDSLGRVIVVLPPSGSATDVLLQLISSEDGKGDSLIGVKQPFPRTVFQTQHDFNKSKLNVFSWGVKANGIDDDAVAFQNCLNDLKVYYPAGCAVYMPSGEYRFGKTVIIPDRINIFGDGAGTQIRPIEGLLGVSSASIFRFDYGPTTSGAFLRDITITGDDIVKGIDTTLKKTDAVIRQVYGLNFSGVTVNNCSIGYEMQGWWHSSMKDCRAGGCNIGLRLLGQCVSINIDACKFTGKGLSQPNSIGIDIQPESYTWSSNLSVVSESILINGETMCISNNVGIWAKGSLHMHIDKTTLDFVGNVGLILEKNNANFSMRDTWIAAQGDSTKQFIGIDLRSQTPAILRNFTGLEIRCDNANTLNNNIGISLGIGVSNVNIKQVAISGGAQSIYGKTSRNITIKESTFDKTVYLDDIDGLDMEDNYMGVFTLLNSPAGRKLNIGINNNINTRGIIAVQIASGATSGTANIPSPVNGVTYGVRTVSVNSSASKDTASVTGGVITVQRPTAVGVAIASYVEYFIIGN